MYRWRTFLQLVYKGVKQVMKYLTKKQLQALLKIRTPRQILYSFMQRRINLKADQIQMLIDLKENKDIS